MATPVMRQVERRLFPSTNAETTATRLDIGSLFMRDIMRERSRIVNWIFQEFLRGLFAGFFGSHQGTGAQSIGEPSQSGVPHSSHKEPSLSCQTRTECPLNFLLQ